MLSRKSRVTTLTVLLVLSFSTFIPALAYAAPMANSDKDWQYVNGNSWAWNYSPQTQINKDNIQNIEIKWVFPVGSKGVAPAALQALTLSDGANTPPIVRGGVVYITTNFMKTYAIDAKSGKQLWAYDYVIDITDVQKRLPLKVVAPHFHGIRYWEGGDAILVNGIACDFYGIDAKTGQNKLWVKELCTDIPGNVFNYQQAGASTNVIATYEKGRQFLFALGRADSSGWIESGRSVIMGIDMDTKNILWRLFNDPPQGVPNKDWALQECDIGYFRDIPCKDVAARARENLEWDQAPAPGEPPFSGSGATANWGQPVIDEDTGLIYMQTGNQLPWTNISQTIGPRLYGSTIMAIDTSKGQRIWWLQPMPRDPYDYDCNWSGILTEQPATGKVYMKGCKEGLLFAIDAKTGIPKYKRDIVEETYPGKRNAHLTDPFSKFDMREWKWPDDGKYHNPGAWIVPDWGHGAFSTDMSYDGQDTLYHYAALSGRQIVKTLPLVKNSGSGLISNVGKANVTIVARDIATGNIKWTWFYEFSNQRSHMVVTGGMVFSGFTDGTVKFIDKDTGKLIHTYNVGTGIVTGPTIGKDTDGNSKIFVIAGGTSILSSRPGYLGLPLVPGTLVALGLSDRAAAEAKTTTITTTSVTTTSTTITSATTQTVTSTSATTVTTAGPAQTVTTSVTGTAGLPAEITYAAVAIAVIAIIGAAVLVMRKK